MRHITLAVCFLIPTLAAANPPVASYIFPAGAQRGTKVNVRVGGLFLHDKCGFEMLGSGVKAPTFLTRTKTLWFEGPILPLPDSQRVEDYPKDMAGTLAIDGNATPGVRYWRLWTSQGATPAMKFVVGELPEIVEDEIDGDPIPVPIKLPVTINGRIFPREDIDIYSFKASKGQSVRCEVQATRLGSPLDARLEVRDAQGRRLAEADAPTGGDPVLRFIAPADGEYQVRIQDALNLGGQAHVYRLTISADAHIERIFPLGGRRGRPIQLEAAGQAIPDKLVMLIPADAPADYAHVFTVGTKRTNAVVLDVDDLPEFRDPSKPIALPAVLNGRIAKAGDIDTWKWQGKKGDTWDFELRALRLGSKLDGIVTISEAAGRTLTGAEAATTDPTLHFVVPADGDYVVQVKDRFRSRGGPDFAYRLRVTTTPTVADFRLSLTPDARQPSADAITLPRKGTAKLKLTVERIARFGEAIALEIPGLPPGVTFTPTTIPSPAVNVDLTFKADATAKIEGVRLTIVGKAKVAGQVVTRQATWQPGRVSPAVDSVLLAVALPTPFVIKGEYDMGFAARGAIHKRKYKIERNGYNGPIEISLADKQARHLQGVEGPTITIPPFIEEFTYAAYLPPWMETGRTCRVCVMGVGVIEEPNGTQHRVSFSSVNQNEQLVAVVGPGKLAIEADRTSFTAEPGKSFTVPVRIKRGQGVEGVVELELIVPAHQRGISAAKATIAGKDERGELVVTCAKALAGPFTMPVIVRATLRQGGEPIVAEVKLDVQP